MTNKGKIFIGCGAVILIFVLALAGFTFYLRNNKEFQEYSRQDDMAREEGRYFGKTTDQYGCLHLGLSRLSEVKQPSRDQIALTGRFVDECLEYSKPTTDFCKDVPKVVVTDWIREQCSLIRRKDDEACYVVFDVKTTYCAGL